MFKIFLSQGKKIRMIILTALKLERKCVVKLSLKYGVDKRKDFTWS